MTAGPAGYFFMIWRIDFPSFAGFWLCGLEEKIKKLKKGVYRRDQLFDNYGYFEKLPFRPISASQKNEKCPHISNVLRFLIFLLLDLERKF